MDAKQPIRLHGESRVPRPPSYAGPVRRALHLAVSVAGWAVFFYWWEIVLPDVTRKTAVLTGLFLLGSLVIVVSGTQLWSRHNKRLYDRKGPRTRVRGAPEDYSHDRMDRAVHFEGSRELIQGEPEVEVGFDNESKTYRPVRVSSVDDPSQRRSGEGR